MGLYGRILINYVCNIISYLINGERGINKMLKFLKRLFSFLKRLFLFLNNLSQSDPSNLKELKKYLKEGRKVYCVFRNTDGTVRYKDIMEVTKSHKNNQIKVLKSSDKSVEIAIMRFIGVQMKDDRFEKNLVEGGEV